MKDFSELKQTIVASIKANGRGAITGNLLQEQLLMMADSMELQSFEGFATPTTTPVRDNTAEHLYFAMESGDYSAFVEGLELDEGDFYMIYRMPDEEEWTAVDIRKWMKGDPGEPGKDGADGGILFPSTGIDEEGNLYIEVPDDEESTNLVIDEEGFLCVKMPDLR